MFNKPLTLGVSVLKTLSIRAARRREEP